MVFISSSRRKIKVSWNLPLYRFVLSLRAVLTAQEALSTAPGEVGSRVRQVYTGASLPSRQPKTAVHLSTAILNSNPVTLVRTMKQPLECTPSYGSFLLEVCLLSYWIDTIIPTLEMRKLRLQTHETCPVVRGREQP